MRMGRRPAAPLPLDPHDARQAAFTVGLRWLAGREMSTSRVRDRLLTRGFDEQVVADTVERLTRAGALDDTRAVRAAARTLAAVKQRGRHRIARELERQGFDASHVEAALAEVAATVDEAAIAARLVESRTRGRRIPDAAAYRRLYGMLMRRGFSTSVIREALTPYWRGRSAVDEA
jgi:regulatory protein